MTAVLAALNKAGNPAKQETCMSRTPAQPASGEVAGSRCKWPGRCQQGCPGCVRATYGRRAAQCVYCASSGFELAAKRCVVLVQGDNVTQGLRKVTDNMKTKNRADRTGAVSVASKPAGEPAGFEQHQYLPWAAHSGGSQSSKWAGRTVAALAGHLHGCPQTTPLYVEETVLMPAAGQVLPPTQRCCRSQSAT